jgi:phosphoglycolate phosphatase
MRRLVLFDIDGTLLTADGAGRRAIHHAMMAVYGATGPIDAYSFAGRTDPQIVTELLAMDGWERPAVEERFPALWELYLANLARELERVSVHALPGVRQVLERVESHGRDVVLGLLTGNVVEGARMKVDAAGIGFRRFAVGAFGSDHADRPELPAVAARRAAELTGIAFAGKEIVIVGDTPFDIACGEHLGVRTIAVATGGHGVDELAACHPDHVFSDLSDVDAVWRAIAD